VRPLGKVVTGIGNGDGGLLRRATEGVLTDRVIGTYLHGPVLARNPALADHILQRVLHAPLAELDVQDQQALRNGYLSRTRAGSGGGNPGGGSPVGGG
jgi:hypothetical protein